MKKVTRPHKLKAISCGFDCAVSKILLMDRAMAMKNPHTTQAFLTSEMRDLCRIAGYGISCKTRVQLVTNIESDPISDDNSAALPAVTRPSSYAILGLMFIALA
jgi:hypothetical protein